MVLKPAEAKTYSSIEAEYRSIDDDEEPTIDGARNDNG
jgi:hypothetical protein